MMHKGPLNRTSARWAGRRLEGSVKGRGGVTATAAQILGILAVSPEPLGAYDVLEHLREHGRYDPPTVYRALTWLTRNHLVHRLETLKAYVARRSGPSHLGSPEQDIAALYIICDRCRSVGEIDDPELGRLIGHRATEAMFTPRTGTIEILGLCAQCRSQEPSTTERDGPMASARYLTPLRTLP